MKPSFYFFIFLAFFSSSRLKAANFDNLQYRIENISEKYLGYPYIINPLGENNGYDQDPLYRFDGFDCVTYVETILALSLTENSKDFLPMMNQIRYKNGEVNFLTRNHFTSIDWNLNNQRNHLLKDATKTLFDPYTRTVRTPIDKSSWFKKNHKMNVDLSVQISSLDYLPLDFISQKPELVNRIKSGSIINIVKTNYDSNKLGTRLDISHQGFVILKPSGTLYFRHASSAQKKVIEVPLIPYLKKQKFILGINVLEPLEF